MVCGALTDGRRIDSIIADGHFKVELSYPLPRTRLYKLRKPAMMTLRDAHTFLRGHAEVKAAPVLKALVLNNHTVVDPEGLRLIPGNRGLTMTKLP